MNNVEDITKMNLINTYHFSSLWNNDLSQKNLIEIILRIILHVDTFWNLKYIWKKLKKTCFFMNVPISVGFCKKQRKSTLVGWICKISNFWTKTIGGTLLFFSKNGRFDTFWNLKYIWKKLKKTCCFMNVPISVDFCKKQRKSTPVGGICKISNFWTKTIGGIDTLLFFSKNGRFDTFWNLKYLKKKFNNSL